MKFSEIEIGSKFEFEKNITSSDVLEFSKVTGDNNPIHLDDSYAKTTIFKQKIVHGLFIGSLFSKAIASDLPGPGSIYINQSMNFIRTIFHDSTVRICIEVESLKHEKQIVFLKTTCWIDDQMVIDGTAIVKCLE